MADCSPAGRYGLLILACEGIGASAVTLYGLTIIRCMPPDYVAQLVQPAQPGEGYDVQVWPGYEAVHLAGMICCCS